MIFKTWLLLKMYFDIYSNVGNIISEIMGEGAKCRLMQFSFLRVKSFQMYFKAL